MSVRGRLCGIVAVMATVVSMGVVPPVVANAAGVDGGVSVASSRYSIEDLKNVKVTWSYFSGPDYGNDHVVDGFDYRNPGPYYMPPGDTHAGVWGLTGGWYTEGHSKSGEVDWIIYAPDGTAIITYTIKQDTSLQNYSELANIKVTVNGDRLSTWNPSTDTYDLRSSYPNGATVRFSNVPAGWTQEIYPSSSNGVSSFSVMWKRSDPYGNIVGSNYFFLGASYSADAYIPPVETAPDGMTAVYRLYNPNGGKHHYTTNVDERNMLIRAGWNYEHVAFNQPTSGMPVYRVYNLNDGNHHWTSSKAEYDHLVSIGWRGENIAWYQDTGGNVTVYRAYNPGNGEHLYTTNKGEYDKITREGWRGEEIAWKTR